jgi:hypothetical protein
MLRNGLYSLAAVSIDGVGVEVGGVLILHNGKVLGGDAYALIDAIKAKFHSFVRNKGMARKPLRYLCLVLQRSGKS